MLLLLIYILGPSVGYVIAHYGTLTYFHLRTIWKTNKFKVQKGAYTV